MINIMLMTFLFLMIPLIMMLLNMIMSKKMFYSREKSSPIECGFDPISNSRIPYSNQFFLISLIFLIFDIEITLLIPLVIMMKSFNLPMILSSILFLMILIFGLYLEYLEQSLDWKK